MKKTLITLAMLTGLSLSLLCLEVPALTGSVNDYAGVLTDDQEVELENLLRQTETGTSSQVVLLTIPTLEDEVLEDFAIRVAETWKLGQKEYDNGVLLLIAMAERKIRIEVGYGLESILTDAKCAYIIRKLMVDHFRAGDNYAGIKAGLTSITGIINKEFDISPEELEKFKKESEGTSGRHFPFGIIVFIIIVVLSSLKKGTRGGGVGSSAPWIFFGGGGGFSSGGGGFSGGGFSGGGGSFGGGGSSGGW